MLLFSLMLTGLLLGSPILLLWLGLGGLGLGVLFLLLGAHGARCIGSSGRAKGHRARGRAGLRRLLMPSLF